MVSRGIIANIHKGVKPDDRAEAERIAVLHQRAIGHILYGTAFVDETGERYWKGDIEGAVMAWNEAFDAFRTARSRLEEVLKAEMGFKPRIMASPRIGIEAELGLNKAGIDFEAILARNLLSLAQQIAWLDHILLMEPLGPEALRGGDIKRLYKGVSEPARALVEAACRDLLELVKDSRSTHNAADIIYASGITEEKLLAMAG